jgi:DNA-binding MarR family transcriptional regulator
MNNIEILNRSFTDIYQLIRKIRFELAAETNMNCSEFELLAYLYTNNHPCSIKEVSRNLLLCSQAITKIAKSLIRKGLVTTEKNEDDKRVTYLLLTDKGKLLASREHQLREHLIRIIIRTHSSAEVDATVLMMDKLNQTLKSFKRKTKPSNQMVAA